MAGIRIFQRDSVRLWFVDEEGEGKRELDQVGGLGGRVDWEATARTLRVLPAGEGLELEFVYQGDGEGAEGGEVGNGAAEDEAEKP